jgi:hypothetical protein
MRSGGVVLGALAVHGGLLKGVPFSESNELMHEPLAVPDQLIDGTSSD